jgi:hypothetical protein
LPVINFQKYLSHNFCIPAPGEANLDYYVQCLM